MRNNEKTLVVFAVIMSILMLAAVIIAHNRGAELASLREDLKIKAAEADSLRKQLDGMDHRRDMINLCKVLMEGIDDGKCENMYAPKHDQFGISK